MKKNTDIREYADKKDVFLYEIASKLNMQDTNFSKLLRVEMTNDEKDKIFSVIDQIAKEKEA